MFKAVFKIFFLLFAFASAEISVKKLCKQIAIVESGDKHFYDDGSLVKNNEGNRFGRMQIYDGVIDLYNRITGVGLPPGSYSNEQINKIVGYWYVRYLVITKKCKYRAANSFNMGPNRKATNPNYLYKVFGHTNFLTNQTIINYWHYAGKKYPVFKNFP